MLRTDLIQNFENKKFKDFEESKPLFGIQTSAKTSRIPELFRIFGTSEVWVIHCTTAAGNKVNKLFVRQYASVSREVRLTVKVTRAASGVALDRGWRVVRIQMQYTLQSVARGLRKTSGLGQGGGVVRLPAVAEAESVW